MIVDVREKEAGDLLAHPLVAALLDRVSDGVLVIDARTRKILAMNKRARTLLGYKKKDVLGCQCSKMMNSPACTMACPLTALMEGRNKDATLNLYYRGKQNRVFLQADTRMLLVRGPDKQPLLGIELFQDLSEVRLLRKSLGKQRALDGMVGNAPVMRELYELVEQLAPYPVPVLLSGESGVGKERFADAIHQHSTRAEGSLVKINCATLARDLAESELFGHCKGAFTGALNHRKGFFEEADGGTLLLDEVGELPLGLQAKLLRVLQEGEIQRVGEDRPRKVDVRLLAATNRDLEREVAEGRFRQDLFFRLSVAQIRVPPLRERLTDIPALAAFFLDRFSTEFKCPRPKLAASTLPALTTRAWPGNVRELENVLRLATIRAMSTGVISPEHIGEAPNLGGGDHDSNILNLKELERRAIKKAMARSDQNLTAAARLLGIDRTTLWRKLK